MERSLEMVVGLLGVLKAGGVYLPLEPLHPPARSRDLMRRGLARVLVTQLPGSELSPFFPGALRTSMK